MDVFQAFILGIIEGVTEFLPISSTGHLILTQQFWGIGADTFSTSFNIAIQFGAILSVVFLYWKAFFKKELLKKLLTAFLPTAVVGLAFYKIVKTYFLVSANLVLWSLFLGGIILIVFELWYKKYNLHQSEVEETEVKDISYKQAVALGLFQSIAIIPGVSRSAATIVGGLWLGLKRTTIVEFSFLLAVPTMLAATVLDLEQNYQSFSLDQFGVLAVGFVVSFLVALASIKFLLAFIKKYTFIPFGIYRIIIAILFWLVI